MHAPRRHTAAPPHRARARAGRAERIATQTHRWSPAGGALPAGGSARSSARPPGSAAAADRAGAMPSSAARCAAAARTRRSPATPATHRLHATAMATRDEMRGGDDAEGLTHSRCGQRVRPTLAPPLGRTGLAGAHQAHRVANVERSAQHVPPALSCSGPRESSC
jgi:hypothetical protein